MIVLENKLEYGRYNALIQLDDGNGMRMQFFEHLSDEEIISRAQEVVDYTIAQQMYNTIETFQFNVIDNAELLKEFIYKIKENPNVTLIQYNNWLNAREWYQIAIIKYFVYTLAIKLADKKGIMLTDLTEAQVLQKLRDWIVATDLRTIGKVIGYGTPND